MTEIHTCLDEIIDTPKKLKDAVPADVDHQDTVRQDIVIVTIETNLRQGEAVVKEEVVTLTATIETNFRQGDLETEVDDTKWEEGRIIDFFACKRKMMFLCMF